MLIEPKKETVAVRCQVEGRRVCLELADGRQVSFPAAKFPLLADAPQRLLERVNLRLDGLALRWEELDEDIWVDDAVCGRFPHPPLPVASRSGIDGIIASATIS